MKEKTLQYLDAPSQFSWLTKQPLVLASHLVESVGDLPDDLQVDDSEFTEGNYKQEDFHSIVQGCSNYLNAKWYDKQELRITLESPDTVKWYQYKPFASVQETYDWLDTLSFDVCIGGLAYIDWLGINFEHKTQLLGGHYPLGWLLAFKGQGHKHLISTRWLDYAPVKVHRQGDTTFVQCHQLSVDAETALSQAKPAWKSMSPLPEGGFLSKNRHSKTGMTGQYDAADGSMSIVVVGRDPSLQELQEVCLARNFYGAKNGQEIKKVIYVFMEPERAEKHLHQLWLREIECHTFIDGVEVNLSESYVPPKNNYQVEW